jgi:hypothetical protein
MTNLLPSTMELALLELQLGAKPWLIETWMFIKSIESALYGKDIGGRCLSFCSG